MKKLYGVIGLGRFGMSVAQTLNKMGQQFVAIDLDSTCVEGAAHLAAYCVQADASDEEALRTIGIHNCDVVMVAVGDVETSLMTTLLLKEMGVKNVIVKATGDLHAKLLAKVGADRIVFPERDMGTRIARIMVSPNIFDFIDLSKDFRVIDMAAPAKWIGKSLMQLDVRSKHNVSIIAIQRQDKIDVSPGGNDIIQEGDMLFVIGSNQDVDRLENLS